MKIRLRHQRHAAASVRGLAVTACAVSALSGCGPAPPLEISVHEFQSSIVYGAGQQTAPLTVPAPAPAPAPIPAPVIGSVPTPLPPTFYPPAPSLVVATPPPQCPAADPLAPAADPATPTATGPPQAASYAWRDSGTWVPGAGAAAQQFPKSSTETIGNVSASTSGEFSFDVTNTAGGLSGTQTVTTTYQVVPQANEVGGVTGPAGGIYITKISSGSATFVPTPPITYLQFPAKLGASWTVNSAYSGADPNNPSAQTVEQLTATIERHGRVDACGTVLDSWEVHAKGTIQGATQTLTIDELYDVGTEYGGIPLQQTATIKGTIGSDSVRSQSVETIDVRPAAAP